MKANQYRDVFILLAVLAGFSLACAAVSSSEMDEIKTLTAKMESKDHLNCLEALKRTAKYEKNLDFNSIKYSEEAKYLVDRVTVRCEYEARQYTKQTFYGDAVDLLEAWKRTHPRSFPEKSKSFKASKDFVTARGLLERLKPLVTKQKAAFKESYANYNIYNEKYPALAYHYLLKGLKQKPSSVKDAQKLDAARTDLLARLFASKQLPHQISFESKGIRENNIKPAYIEHIKSFKTYPYQEQNTYAKLTISLGKVQSKTGKKVVMRSHRYVTGQKLVPNPTYVRASKDYPRIKRQLQSAQERYRTTSGRKGGMRSTIEGIKKSLASARKGLKAPRQVLRNTYGTFKYKVDRPFKTMSYPVKIKVTWPTQPKNKPLLLKYTATSTSSASIHKSYPKYKLSGQNIPIAPDVDILKDVQKNVISTIMSGLNDINKHRLFQVKQNKKTPEAEANHWFFAFCVVNPSLQYTAQSKYYKSMDPKTRKIVRSDRCDTVDYNLPLNGSLGGREKYPALKALDRYKTK